MEKRVLTLLQTYTIYCCQVILATYTPQRCETYVLLSLCRKKHKRLNTVADLYYLSIVVKLYLQRTRNKDANLLFLCSCVENN